MARRAHEDRHVDLAGVQASKENAPVGLDAFDLHIRMRLLPVHQGRP